MGRRRHVRGLSRRLVVVDPNHWRTPAGPLSVAGSRPLGAIAARALRFLAIVQAVPRPHWPRRRGFLAVRDPFRAVRLIQRVHEQTRDLAELFANSICQLQLSWNILREPEPACVHLLGLELISEEA